MYTVFPDKLLKDASNWKSPVDLKNGNCRFRWMHNPTVAAHCWSASRQTISLMKVGNRSLSSRVVAAHSVHNLCVVEPSGIVPRPWHPRNIVPGDEGMLLLLRWGSVWKSDSSAGRLTTLCVCVTLEVGVNLAAVVVVGDMIVVKSSNPHASITVTAMYRLMSPPTVLSCSISSAALLRKHTIGPGSSWTRDTLVWFRQNSGPGIAAHVAGIDVVFGLTNLLRQGHCRTLRRELGSLWALGQGNGSRQYSSSGSASEEEEYFSDMKQMKTLMTDDMTKACFKKNNAVIYQ